MIQPAKLLRTALVTAVLSTVCVVSASAASVGVGTVNTDALRLRDEASTSATVLGTASKGDTVVVLEDAGNGWYKVDYKSVEGYMSGEYLNVSAKADVTIGYGLVQSQGSPLNVRSGPGTSYGKVTSLNNGAVVNIVGIDNGWYKISFNGKTGYVRSDYMTITKEALSSRGTEAAAASAASSKGSEIVAYAKQYLGAKYVYAGASSKGFDCSGYTMYVMKHFGYNLPHTATGQMGYGTSVAKSALQPGDLVFFCDPSRSGGKAASHVGIYIGGGQFIHASTNTYTVKIDNLNSGYYSRVYVYGRHIL